jgi:hypothetical protein
MGAAWPWRRKGGREQPRQRRDRLVLPDGLGPAIKTRRCNESEPVAKSRKRRADPKPGGWVGQQRAPTEYVVVGDSQDRWQIAGPEAMVKDCGVAMARLPGHSWAPTSSTVA